MIVRPPLPIPLGMDTIGDQILNRTTEIPYFLGPLDGATMSIPLDVALAGASARAIEIVARHPATGERIEGAAYRLRALIPPDDEGVSLDPEAWEHPTLRWVYAGEIQTIL